MNFMKLIKQTLRKQIALGVQGTPEEIQGRLDSLINWQAIESYQHAGHPYDGLHLGKPLTFQYVLITEERLRDYLINLVSLDFDIERLDMQSLPLLAHIRKQANMMLAAIPETCFLPVPLSERQERESAATKAKAEIAELATRYQLTGK